MIRWTTPTLVCEIPKDVECEYVLLTLKQISTVLEKRINSSEIVDGVFNVFFTQKETSQFKTNYDVEAQLNIINEGTRLATNIVKIRVDENLHNSYIDE